MLVLRHVYRAHVQIPRPFAAWMVEAGFVLEDREEEEVVVVLVAVVAEFVVEMVMVIWKLDLKTVIDFYYSFHPYHPYHHHQC